MTQEEAIKKIEDEYITDRKILAKKLNSKQYDTDVTNMVDNNEMCRQAALFGYNLKQEPLMNFGFECFVWHPYTEDTNLAAEADALWAREPVCEPYYFGCMMDDNFPLDYYTHFMTFPNQQYLTPPQTT